MVGCQWKNFVMNKIFIVFVVLFFVFGCRLFSGAGKNVEVANNSNVITEVTPEPTRPAVTPTPVPTPSEVMPAGVKVDKVMPVKYADGKFVDGWQWIDPDGEYSPTKHEFKDNRLTMTIPTTKDLYGGNRTAPRLLKAVKGDFQIETRVNFVPTHDYQGAGLLIYLDGDNYIRLERAFGGIGGGGSGIRLDVRRKDIYEPLATPIDIPTTTTNVNLKISRRLNVFSTYWREDESGEWRLIEDIDTAFGETIQAGIVACNTAEETEAEFQQIKLSPQPLQKPF